MPEAWKFYLRKSHSRTLKGVLLAAPCIDFYRILEANVGQVSVLSPAVRVCQHHSVSLLLAPWQWFRMPTSSEAATLCAEECVCFPVTANIALLISSVVWGPFPLMVYFNTRDSSSSGFSRFAETLFLYQLKKQFVNSKKHSGAIV